MPKYRAKVVSLEHKGSGKERRSIYTLEYEENGETKRVTTDKEPSSWIEEGAAVEIDVENGELISTDIGKNTMKHTLVMIVCLLVSCAVFFGWILLIVFVKSWPIRIGLILIGAAVWILMNMSPKNAR